jgi:hypothetical protein
MDSPTRTMTQVPTVSGKANDSSQHDIVEAHGNTLQSSSTAAIPNEYWSCPHPADHASFCTEFRAFRTSPSCKLAVNGHDGAAQQRCLKRSARGLAPACRHLLMIFYLRAKRIGVS